MSWRRSSAFLREAAAQQSANRSRHWRGQAVPGRFLVHDRREHVGHGLPCKRPLARQQLEEQCPEGPDVRPLVHSPPARLLGGHVARGPQDHSRLGARLRQCRRLRQIRRRARGRVPRIGLGQAEVEHLDLAVRRHLHVGGLQIAVDDALLVRGLERLGDLPRDGDRLGDGQPSPLQALGQVLPFHQLEDEEGPAVRFFEAVDRRDVRVVERGEQLRFASESGQALGIGRHLEGQHLDRHLAVELRVGRAVDLSHTAGADRLDQAIVRERLPRGQGHRGRSSSAISRPALRSPSINCSTRSGWIHFPCSCRATYP